MARRKTSDLKIKDTQHFTSENLIDYLVSYLPEDKSISILEPSCGDGAILSRLKNLGYTNVTAVEIDKELALKTQEKFNEYTIVNGDFVDIYERFIDKFDYVIGNPPFTFKISQVYGEEYEKRLKKMGFYTHADIASVFLNLSSRCVKKNGGLSLVLPKNICKGNNRLQGTQFIIENGFNIFEWKNLVWEGVANVHVTILHSIKNIEYKPFVYDGLDKVQIRYNQELMDELEVLGKDFYETRQEILKKYTKITGKEVGTTKLYNALKNDNATEFSFFERQEIEGLRQKQHIINRKVFELYHYCYDGLFIEENGKVVTFGSLIDLPKMNDKINPTFERYVYMLIHKLNAVIHYYENK